jgi:hypothetical protein
MATANFYMIYIERGKEITYEQVKTKMNLANDWYRIRPELWIVYSTSDEEKWYSRLSPLVKESGSLFINKLDPESRQGWMSKDFWSWIDREEKT